MKSLTFIVLISATAAAMPPVPRVILPDADPATATAEELKDAAKLAERIAKASRIAGDKLAAEETGAETRREQKQVKDDLDALIRLLDNPPPQSSSSSSSSKSDSPKGGSSKNESPMGGEPPPMPMGGTSSPKGSPPQEPKGPPSPQAGKQPPPRPMPGTGEPGKTAGTPLAPGSDKQAGKPGGTAGTEAGKGGQSLPTLPLEESIARDFWGHLPDAPRQRMMQFFREQYMPKYKDLLGDYYQSLSEKEKPARK